MVNADAHAGDFDGLAADYERYRVGYSGSLFDGLESLGFRRGMRVLDAGCGTGLATEPLAARGLNITGIDPSAEMLAGAKRSVPAATFVEGRAEQLPFADRSFDAVVCAQAFHWFEADAAYAELCRVVKPGGSVAVWWKILGSDDPMRALRAAACERAGVEASAEPLRGGFRAFYRAPFAVRTLRVIPFNVRFSIDGWIGYERSRASARNSYAAKCDAYIDALRQVLVAKYGASAARIDVRYTQYLYVGTTAAA